jgi:hypothetical protein
LILQLARKEEAEIYVVEKTVSSTERPKMRKRVVLKKSCDNPLLRPLENARLLSNSSSFVRNSELRPTTIPRRSKSREEVERPSNSPPLASGDGDVSVDDSTGLSDFIVNDSSFVDEDDSEDEIVLPQPPKPVRRLVRGRRPRRRLSQSSEHTPARGREMSRSREDPEIRNSQALSTQSGDCLFSNVAKTPEQATPHFKDRDHDLNYSDIEEPFALLRL